MRVIKSVKTLRSAIKKIKGQNKSIGFVPTMGALHDGHLSLIQKSRRENEITVVSIFVNKKQFGPKEDFSTYPRPAKKDILLAKNEKVDIILYPSDEEMYPTSFLTSIDVDTITGILCGQSRPGHFRGVTTIVGKLLNIVTPDVLYLGQKDFQQAVVLKRMITDLNIPVTVKMCPIVRETDGLALSSRNKNLTHTQRKEAPVVYESLRRAKQNILDGERSTKKIVNAIRTHIKDNSSGQIEYIECTDPNTLKSLKRINGKTMIVLSVKLGKTRLIDNIIVNTK